LEKVNSSITKYFTESNRYHISIKSHTQPEKNRTMFEPNHWRDPTESNCDLILPITVPQ